MRVCLIETSAGAGGSMRQYGDLVAACWGALLGPENVSRLKVAGPERWPKRLSPRLRGWIQNGWIASIGAQRARQAKAELYHVMDGSRAYVARRLNPAQVLVSVHDLIPLLQLRGRRGWPRPSRLGKAFVIENMKQLRKTHHMIAGSRCTRDDLLKEAGVDGGRITVIYPALPLPAAAHLASQSEACDAREPFILHVGHDGFYKNRAGVLRIFRQVRQRQPLRLKMVGTAPPPALRRLAKELGVSSSTEFIVGPEWEQLAAEYRKASVFLFPSLYEGFGWPVLEAMAFGCPVVCSDSGALAEVAGDAAEKFPPWAEEAAGCAVSKLAGDGAFWAKKVEAGFQRAGDFSLAKMTAAIEDVWARNYRTLKD